MRLVVATNERFFRGPSGRIVSHGGGSYESFERYLGVFDEVRVVARVEPSAEPDRGRPAEGPGVSFVELPPFSGISGWLSCRRQVARQLWRAVAATDAVIVRMPAWHLTDLLAQQLRRRRQPFAVEVLGEPRGNLSPRFFRHPLAPLMRIWIPRRTRRICRQARAALYVAGDPLEKLYPAAPGVPTVDCSDVELSSSAFVTAPRVLESPPRLPQVVFVGSLRQLRKGADTVVEAAGLAAARGAPWKLTMVGDGRFRGDLERRCNALGLDDQVRFTGALPAGPAIRAELDRAHAFVLPSHSEGMPRALLEAMARALPSVASAVGGVPAVIDRRDLVAAGDPLALEEKVRALTRDPRRWTRTSERNLARSRDFDASILARRRSAFLHHVRRATAGGSNRTRG